MMLPKTMKEVQRLTRQVSTLYMFVSNTTNKCLPFFKTLKQAFEWTKEYQNCLQESKGVLVKATIPKPVYKMRGPLFVSSSFPDNNKLGLDQRRKQGTKTSILHETILPRCRSKVSSSRKSLICIDCGFKKASSLFPNIADQPIKKAMSKPNATGRLV